MTQTAKHTPGPWDDNDNGLILGNLDNYEDEAPFVADVCKSPQAYTDQERANCRLIKAAPDMLRELRGARLMFHAWLGSRPTEYGPHPELERTIRDIEAVIAKATA